MFSIPLFYGARSFLLCAAISSEYLEREIEEPVGKPARTAAMAAGLPLQVATAKSRVEMFLAQQKAPDGHTYRTYALQSDEIVCDLGFDDAVIAAAAPYLATAKPVFVGHYWLSAQRPELLADNVACLDYSVAKDGFLYAYRW